MDADVEYQTVDAFETFDTNIAFSGTGTELYQQLCLKMYQGEVRLESSDTRITKFADSHRSRSWFTSQKTVTGGVVD